MDTYGKVRELKGNKCFVSFRYQGQYEDEETGLYYNRFRYYSPDSGTYLSQDPIGLAGNNPNIYAYVSDCSSWMYVFGLEMVRVGHWMSQAELDQMISTNRVVESFTGTTHVASPANIDAFGKQAKNGTKYVEFDVPNNSLVRTNDGWTKIIGPNSLEGRLSKKKGLHVSELPEVKNINVIAEKVDGKIKKLCG